MMAQATAIISPNPFQLPSGNNEKPFQRMLLALAGYVSGLNEMAARYERLPTSTSPVEFTNTVLQHLNIAYYVHGRDARRLPESGPSIIVANHPFGGIEGVILANHLCQHRRDVRILANSLLKRIPELSELLIGVDPYATNNSTTNNIRPMREAVQWLKQGGMLLVFPAGDVSRFNWHKCRAEDGHWDKGIIQLATKTNATITPMFIEGQNSLLFQLIGSLHPRLKSLLLPRELLNKQHQCISLYAGQNIPPRRLGSFRTNDEAARFLRLETLVLKQKNRSWCHEYHSSAKPVGKTLETLIPAIEPDLMQWEIDALPSCQCLHDDGQGNLVFEASDTQIPNIMLEIGRLRELSFRAVGEGTGQSIDLDHFDRHYRHLFIWQSEKQQIIGAYRLGLTDQILMEEGKQGLYSSSLFKYRSKFLEAIDPAIELGRSFVHPEYQRGFAPLMLLWKGIGKFVVRHPHYSRLFGPVSISNTYSSMSQQLLIDFLQTHNMDWQLGRHVKPRQPFSSRIRPIWRKTDIEAIASLDGISELVSVIEEDNKGVPILLKQYLKLGGRMLGFNIDSDFNDCLDALVLVDLTLTDSRILAKYMDQAGAQAFLEHQKKHPSCIPTGNGPGLSQNCHK